MRRTIDPGGESKGIKRDKVPHRSPVAKVSGTLAQAVGAGKGSVTTGETGDCNARDAVQQRFCGDGAEGVSVPAPWQPEWEVFRGPQATSHPATQKTCDRSMADRSSAM